MSRVQQEQSISLALRDLGDIEIEILSAIVGCLKQMTFSLEVSRFEIQKLADKNRQLIDAVKTTTGEKANG